MSAPRTEELYAELSDEVIQAIEDSCDECGHFPLWDCEHAEEPLNFEDD